MQKKKKNLKLKLLLEAVESRQELEAVPAALAIVGIIAESHRQSSHVQYILIFRFFCPPLQPARPGTFSHERFMELPLTGSTLFYHQRPS